MTVLEVIQRSTEFLTRKGVGSARLQVELLMAHVLKLPRLKLYLNFERPVTDAELDALRELVKRRGAREPLQHILGSASFCGWEIVVNRNVLIPRPETEQLAEKAWRFLGVREQPEVTALDFGTGSGCVAIALALQCPRAQIYAIDISREALAVALHNAARHGVSERIRFLESDGLGGVAPDLRLDLIVANPPYIPTREIDGLQPEVRDFDPRLALDGGADGLDAYRRLAVEAASRIKADGRLLVEFGDGQAEALREIFERQKWIVEALEADYSGRLRFLTAGLARQHLVSEPGAPRAEPRNSVN